MIEYSLSGSYRGFYIDESLELLYVTLTVEGPKVEEGDYVLTFVEFNDTVSLNMEAYYCIVKYMEN